MSSNAITKVILKDDENQERYSTLTLYISSPLGSLRNDARTTGSSIDPDEISLIFSKKVL